MVRMSASKSCKFLSSARNQARTTLIYNSKKIDIIVETLADLANYQSRTSKSADKNLICNEKLLSEVQLLLYRHFFITFIQ